MIRELLNPEGVTEHVMSLINRDGAAARLLALAAAVSLNHLLGRPRGRWSTTSPESWNYSSRRSWGRPG